jgi:hypothetical protein
MNMCSRLKGIFLYFSLAFFFPCLIIHCSSSKKTASAGTELTFIGNQSLKDELNGEFKDYFSAGRKIVLGPSGDSRLGPMPSIGGINRRGEFIILDNFGVRQILVYDGTGTLKARIGSRGIGDGQYLYPDNMFVDRDSGHSYVSDGDLLRVLEYDEDNKYVAVIPLPIYMEQLLITKEGRLFCYTSGAAGPKGAERVIYEFNKTGHIRNRFLRMSNKYISAAESKGGGMILFKGLFYVITPYEYTISKCNPSGEIVAQARVKSPYYTEIKTYTDKRVETDFNERKRYHSTWSHIRQIIKIGDDRFGVVYNEARSERYYLDIFSSELKVITQGILLPGYLIAPHAIYTIGNELYWLEPAVNQNSADSADIAIAEYTFKIKQ